MPGRPSKSREQKTFERMLGLRLTQIRKSVADERGDPLSQAAFAEKLGVSLTAYQKWELKGAVPTYALPRICMLTGFDPWYVLTGQISFDEAMNQADELGQPIPPEARNPDRTANGEARLRRISRKKRRTPPL